MSLLVGFVSFLLFVSFQAQGIYGGDSGDLVAAAATGGVPHPPGYPLYTFLGWLASKLPLFTPAWRVGLLSSLPHAATVALVFLITATLTKRIVPALFSAFVLAGNYLFFLYSVTPEVFALFDLFVVLLLFCLVTFYQTKKFQYVYATSLIFGLSLAHHHAVLFLVPAIVSVWGIRGIRDIGRKGKIALVFLLGLLPYLYIPIAARGNSIINWDRAVDIHGFIRLISRADYGTFVSGGFYGSELTHRLIALKAYGQFLFLDFSWIGLLLAVLGFFFLFRCERKLCWTLSLALLFLGPFFFFYASFPLINGFTIGTYERFLLPSYVIVSILMGVGFAKLVQLVKLVKFGKSASLAAGLALLLFLLPAARGYSTIWRFWGLSTDKTAQNLGQDLLSSLPDTSMLLLSGDTPLFTTQYVRYALGVRQDIKVIHTHRLESDEYLVTLARVFRDLTIPSAHEPDVLASLIRANSDRFPIFANRRLLIPAGWFWVPRGLVFQLVTEKKLPHLVDLKKDNDAVLATLHDPTLGILSRYNHLFLSDVRDVYTNARIVYGKILLRGNDLTGALSQFQTAVHYAGDAYLGEAYTYVGLAQLFLGNCREANDALASARGASIAPDKTITLYEASVARDCEKNPTRAAVLMRTYEAARQAEDTPLGGR